jgi:hypothetical protein
LSVIESLEDSGGEGLLDVLMAAVLATAASPSPLASESRAEERVDESWARRSSSISVEEAATAATKRVNFICNMFLIIKELCAFDYKGNELTN